MERITSDDINRLIKSIKRNYEDVEWYPIASNSYILSFKIGSYHYSRKIRGTKRERYNQLEIIEDLTSFFSSFILKK